MWRENDDQILALSVSGSRTVVHAYGFHDRPSIVAVHGFRGTHYGLEPLARGLAEAGYRVLVPDLPGAGDSSPLRGAHDALGYGSWLRDLVRHLPARLLLGHSFGSVVVGSAIAQGARYDGTILINPILELPLAGSRRVAIAAARLYYNLVRCVPERTGRRLLASRLVAALGGALMTSTTDQGLRRWIRGEHLRQAGLFYSRDVVLESYFSSVNSTVVDFAEHITKPSLVLGADRDPFTSVAAHTREASGLLKGTFQIFRGRGHLLPYEETSKLVDCIRNWEDQSLLGLFGAGEDA